MKPAPIAFSRPTPSAVRLCTREAVLMTGRVATTTTLQVIDTGCGMSRADQDKLFSLYTSINSPDNFASERSGLGLLLSRELCRALGGELYLHESHEGAPSHLGFPSFDPDLRTNERRAPFGITLAMRAAV
jgi:signal transduction histidine kinase